MLTQARLKELFDYYPDTGLFISRIRMSNRAIAKDGEVAGGIRVDGYIRLCIDRKHYLGHRLAWLYVHGQWPDGKLDHKNGIRSDNRLENLREASSSENTRNSKRRSDNLSGHKGVSWNSGLKKWTAKVSIHGQHYYLGFFDDKDEAAKCVIEGRNRLHGEFCNHGYSESNQAG